MSTRGFLTFVAEGVEKTTYNHCDSYPEGLGADVLKWLRDQDLTMVREKATALRVAAKDSKPTAEDIERLKDFARTYVGSQQLDDWYVLLRETQGDPGLMLEAGVIEDGSDFPTDSLFAEWGYVVDLDAQTFEVYEGFQHHTHDKGRFASREGRAGYAPVALLKSYPLADLPTTESFLAEVCGNEDEDS
jgi:hypothetical protein